VTGVARGVHGQLPLSSDVLDTVTSVKTQGRERNKTMLLFCNVSCCNVSLGVNLPDLRKIRGESLALQGHGKTLRVLLQLKTLRVFTDGDEADQQYSTADDGIDGFQRNL
jgi:hypothetical protein